METTMNYLPQTIQLTVHGSTITSSIWVPTTSHPPRTHLHVAAARKRSHQWCVSLTPNKLKQLGE